MTNLNDYSLFIHCIADLKEGNGLTKIIIDFCRNNSLLLQNILLKILEIPLQRAFFKIQFSSSLKLTKLT